MGADNMIQVHKWHDWRSIFDNVFVAVFDRAEFKDAAIASDASKCYNASEISIGDFKNSSLDAGSWYFFKTEKSSISSTILRDINKPGNNNMINVDTSNIEQIKDIVLYSLDADQASDIVVCDLKNKCDFASYMMIVSGRSTRHVCSMIENLMDRLKKINIASRASGLETGNWVLLDAGDIIINAFLPECRELYKLEELWGSRSNS